VSRDGSPKRWSKPTSSGFSRPSSEASRSTTAHVENSTWRSTSSSVRSSVHRGDLTQQLGIVLARHDAIRPRFERLVEEPIERVAVPKHTGAQRIDKLFIP
jgi:hypothetical protein